MIPEFLKHLLAVSNGALFSSDNGVYVVADSEGDARLKLISAMYEELCVLAPQTYAPVIGISGANMPEFLQDLLHEVEGSVFANNDGVYSIAYTEDEARDKLWPAQHGELRELVDVIPVLTN